MADKRDYYEVLGVERGAAPEEIKKAYRRKARELHPDVNRTDPQAEDRFKELGEAYEVLGDANKRAAYDRFGHDGPSAMGGHFTGEEFGFSDLFESFFGAGNRMTRPDPRGADLRYDMEITLEDAAFGAERVIRVPHQATCPTCHGVGAEHGNPVPCPACAGTGQRRQSSSNLFGMQFTTVIPCDRCGATGEIITNPCITCNGTGRTRISEEITVNVPRGVDTGSRIRFRGKGDAGLRGAQAGDLLVAVHVRQHAVFQRRGADLFCEVLLPFGTAALGGKLTVPTLDGDGEVDIPTGTQPGSVFRLRGKGMPDLHGGHLGDLHAVVSLAVPTDLTPRQRELLEEYAEERGENIDHKAKSVFQKVKEAVEDVVDEYRDKAKEAFGN